MSSFRLATLLEFVFKKLRYSSGLRRYFKSGKSLRSIRPEKNRATISNNSGGGTQQRQLQALARRAGIASSSVKARGGSLRCGEGRCAPHKTTHELPVSKCALSPPPSSSRIRWYLRAGYRYNKSKDYKL